MWMRKKLIELLDEITKYYRFDAWENSDKIADFLISNDYVSVVRCEDCKYMVLDTVHGIDWCNHTLGLCSEVYATDFCCHGERKDND
jgi:hypothetical protein